MLPMGTIVACCMFAGVIVAADLPLLRNIPDQIRRTIAVIVFIAGVWNSLWYGLQHLSEFWGISALVSGVLMIITALYVLMDNQLGQLPQKLKPVVLLVLLGYALMYAVTIACL